MADKKARISAKVKAAIDLMIFEGQKRDIAADATGLHRDSMRKALKRPDVLAYLREQQEVLRTSASARTIARAEELADDAESEHVRLQANTWLAGIDGISPLERGVVQHVHHNLPGLVIVTGGAWQPHAVEPGSAPRVIEHRPSINVIGTPRPHPCAIDHGSVRGNDGGIDEK